MYISLIVSIKPYSSPWFSVAFAAAIVHRNHFFICISHQNKSSESKVKFREVNDCCKRVLEAAQLAYAYKTKESNTSQKLGSRDFCQIANSILSKGKSAIPHLFNGLEVLSSASEKKNRLLETFLRTLVLMNWVSLYLFFLLELI